MVLASQKNGKRPTAAQGWVYYGVIGCRAGIGSRRNKPLLVACSGRTKPDAQECEREAERAQVGSRSSDNKLAQGPLPGKVTSEAEGSAVVSQANP